MIIHGKTLLGGAIEEVYIEISNGIIKKISKEKPRGKIHSFNVKGMLILPAMIDIHVHMRDFEQSYKEDFRTGTSAAAAGGVAIVMDMPNTIPRNNDLNILMKRDEEASRKSVVDYGIFYGFPNNPDDVKGYEKWAWGIKIYPGDYNNPFLFDVLRYNQTKKLLTVVHPEDPHDIEMGVRDLGTELRAISMFNEYSERYGYRLHFTHVTSMNSVMLAKKYKPNTSIDTCPHYLLLNRDEYSKLYYRVNPPLRSKYIQEYLLKNLANSCIDAVSTDHAPHTLDEKNVGEGAPGFPGLETALSILITLFKRGYLSLSDIVRLYSSGPAEILGIDKYVGEISEGKYANLTICNIDEEYTVNPKNFMSKASHSPYEGMKLYGKVIATIVRGEYVYSEGEILAKPGYGENLRRIFNIN